MTMAANDSGAPPWPLNGAAAPRFIRFGGRDTLSLRQIDELNNVPKGTAFRRFKARQASLAEGSDFFRLDAAVHAGRIAELRAGGRIYASTVHLVLLTESGYRRLLQPLPDRG
jgi:hypothetical protein